MIKMVVIIFLILSQFLFAQEKTGKGAELTNFTLEQKLDRAVMNAISYMRMGLSYAEALGKTPEEYAVYCANLAIPAWQFLIERNPIDVIDAIYGVQQTDKYFEIEITEKTDASVQGRMRLYGLPYIKASDGFGGVSVEDCYVFYNTFVQTFTKALSFRYEYAIEEDWIVFTLSKDE